MSHLLMSTQIPIVSMDRMHAEQFEGYVVAVKMSAIPGGWVDDAEIDSDDEFGHWDPDYVHLPPAGSGPRFNFMILGREWEGFCIMLAQADAFMDGFSSCVAVDVELGTYQYALPDYKAPISYYFTPKTQETLLHPFRTHITGFQNVSIHGAVDPALAYTVKKEVRRSLWTSPEKVLSELQAAKDAGNTLYTSTSTITAHEKWSEALMRMRRIHSSASWPLLLARGGPDFATTFADLFFTTILNDVQARLRHMQSPSTPSSTILAMGAEITSDLHEAADIPSLFSDYGATYSPPQPLMAKMAYRAALCWRLVGQVSRTLEAKDEALHAALGNIKDAVEVAPGDQTILREREAIFRWGDEVEALWMAGGDVEITGVVIR